MECLICGFSVVERTVCKRCEATLITQLTEIPAMQVEARGFIVPGRGGSGSPSSDRPIGVNVAAMDYSTATDLLPMLHGWEAKIRRGRNLTPPAYLRKAATIDDEVALTIGFHIGHISWTIKQEWVKLFAADIREAHGRGLSVTKKFIEKPRRIPCPTDGCKAHVVIDIENIFAGVSCFKCKTSWTLYRLIQLAMGNPNRRFWLDMDAICIWLNLTKREVQKIIDNNKIAKKNGLYDIAAIVKSRENN